VSTNIYILIVMNVFIFSQMLHKNDEYCAFSHIYAYTCMYLHILNVTHLDAKDCDELNTDADGSLTSGVYNVQLSPIKEVYCDVRVDGAWMVSIHNYTIVHM
jgi:hypothetical protein